ncbi:MAG: acetyl-CoA carboxylase carboxyl transferase subunit alpha, partial [Bacteroidota bacterium]
MTFLDFEKPIEELYEQLNKLKKIGENGKVDIQSTIVEMESKIEQTKQSI